MAKKPVTAIIVGAGHRAMIYGSYSLKHPDELKIVGVADPDPVRRQICMETFGFAPEMCFSSSDELATRRKLADTIINGTMDHQHVYTSLPLIELGYDMLLEKPFAPNEEDAFKLIDAARRNNSKIMICHVLRYSPFYYSIKERILNGEIGDIINIQTNEFVSYHHLATCYVRGKWANSEKSHTTMLLAKCCHDLDLMMWLMGDNKPVSVSSFGSNLQFKRENMPKGAGNICMKDCPYVDTCTFSTKRLYIDHPDRWAFYVWDALEGIKNPTIDDKINLMKSDNPYARCVYKCDNNVVDHQSLIVNFKNGATGTHNMIGGATIGTRKIHIIGTKGEIFGDFDEGKYTLLTIDPSVDALDGAYRRQEIDLKVGRDVPGGLKGHGGGDDFLTEDFVKYVSGEEPSIACTSIFDSIAGHLCVYRADKSLSMGGVPCSLTDIL